MVDGVCESGLMSRSDRTSLHTHDLRLRIATSDVLLLSLWRKCLRNFLTQIDSQKALGQFDSMELGSQSLKNFLPLDVRCQTSARRAADAMLTIQLDVQGIEGVATRRKGDADAVVEVATFGVVSGGFIL